MIPVQLFYVESTKGFEASCDVYDGHGSTPADALAALVAQINPPEVAPAVEPTVEPTVEQTPEATPAATPAWPQQQ